jgi:hypothetical protein
MSGDPGGRQLVPDGVHAIVEGDILDEQAAGIGGVVLMRSFPERLLG